MRQANDHATELATLIALYSSWLERSRQSPPQEGSVTPSALDQLLDAFEKWHDKLDLSLRRPWARELATLTSEQEKLYALYELWREDGGRQPEHRERLTEVAERVLAALHDLQEKLLRQHGRTAS